MTGTLPVCFNIIRPCGSRAGQGWRPGGTVADHLACSRFAQASLRASRAHPPFAGLSAPASGPHHHGWQPRTAHAESAGADESEDSRRDQRSDGSQRRSRNRAGRLFCAIARSVFFALRPRWAADSLSPGVVRWCNGSTEVFGAFSLGSNPGRTATSPSSLSRHTFHCVPTLHRRIALARSGGHDRSNACSR